VKVEAGWAGPWKRESGLTPGPALTRGRKKKGKEKGGHCWLGCEIGKSKLGPREMRRATKGKEESGKREKKEGPISAIGVGLRERKGMKERELGEERMGCDSEPESSPSFFSSFLSTSI